jgi:hypothetical protein
VHLARQITLQGRLSGRRGQGRGIAPEGCPARAPAAPGAGCNRASCHGRGEAGESGSGFFELTLLAMCLLGSKQTLALPPNLLMLNH